MPVEEFITLFHTTRKANKGKWYAVNTIVNGLPCRLKAYGTWVQRIEYNNFIESGPMELSVKGITLWLHDILIS